MYKDVTISKIKGYYDQSLQTINQLIYQIISDINQAYRYSRNYCKIKYDTTVSSISRSF